VKLYELTIDEVERSVLRALVAREGEQLWRQIRARRGHGDACRDDLRRLDALTRTEFGLRQRRKPVADC
jgi:hypothetical protein